MSRYESREDVRRFTKRRRFRAQCAVLRERGIAFTLADDGEPLVPAGALDGTPRPARNAAIRMDLVNG
jgi:hypothetical protein